MEKTCLFTVGTTNFHQLLKQINSELITLLHDYLGIGRIIIQHGSTPFELTLPPSLTVTVESFSYVESLLPWIEQADLVIGHAGAGTILETLRANKTLVVVVNSDLQDNHQWDLAKEFANLGHLKVCTCSTLVQTILELKEWEKVKFPSKNENAFTELIKEQLL